MYHCSNVVQFKYPLDIISDHISTGTLWHTRSHRHTSTRARTMHPLAVNG